MEQWNGTNILELAKDVVNENDAPVKAKHIEFSVDRLTFEVIKKTLQSDLDKFKNSPLWSKDFPKETIRDKILALSVNGNVPIAAPVLLELSFIELEAINIILRYQMDEMHAEDIGANVLFDTFIKLNFDYLTAGGITSPTFENFMEGR